jgi:hypothetical protein
VSAPTSSYVWDHDRDHHRSGTWGRTDRCTFTRICGQPAAVDVIDLAGRTLALCWEHLARSNAWAVREARADRDARYGRRRRAPSTSSAGPRRRARPPSPPSGLVPSPTRPEGYPTHLPTGAVPVWEVLRSRVAHPERARQLASLRCALCRQPLGHLVHLGLGFDVLAVQDGEFLRFELLRFHRILSRSMIATLTTATEDITAVTCPSGHLRHLDALVEQLPHDLHEVDAHVDV